MDVEVRAIVDEPKRLVYLVVPPLDKLTDDEQRAVLSRALALHREWESKGYAVRY